MELVEAIMNLLVGVSVLLVGMKLMSGGLKKIAGKGLRNFFKKTQNNPVAGMGIGAAVTVIIQSSDATAALVLGFISAGVMTMYQGLSIILGAYIGTTITGILASFSSLSISVYLLGFAFVGTVMMFINNEKVKVIGDILCGFGLLFFGLSVMKAAFANPDISAFCTSLFSKISFPPLLYLIGVLLAAIAQSSSAIMGIVIAMIGGGALGLNGALYIALGATLGTVANTLLSSLNGNIDGKRTAVIAFFIRGMTSLVAMAIVWIFEAPIASFLHLMAINGSDQFPLAMFTVIYNVIFMPLMIPLLKPLIKLSTKVIKDKKELEAAKVIQFIDDNLLKSPDVALMQVRKEIVHMYDLAFENYVLGFNQLIAYVPENTKKVADLEDQVDYLNKRITEYLIKLANLVVSRDENKVGSYFHVINDIERIGDHAYNFSTTAEAMKGEDLAFSEAAVIEIKGMHDVLQGMFTTARDIFVSKDRSRLGQLDVDEVKTQGLKKDFYDHHYERVIKEQCSQEMTPYVSSIIVELERIADHLTNIGYSIISPTGDSD